MNAHNHIPPVPGNGMNPNLGRFGDRTNGHNAVPGTANLTPADTAADVALIDIRMPTLDVIEATRRIVTGALPTRVSRPHHLRPTGTSTSRSRPEPRPAQT